MIETLQKEFDAYLGAWIGRVTPVSIRITDCPKGEWYFRDLQTGYESPYFQMRRWLLGDATYESHARVPG